MRTLMRICFQDTREAFGMVSSGPDPRLGVFPRLQ